ncbi:MAG TPA: hypothetical protein VFZ89_08050 [Solirubrobacteraceae bacterium]
MTIVNLPTYVERGGRTVWQQPYRSNETQLLGLVLKADTKAIDAVLQRDLVAPSDGALDYRCVHPNVLVTFSRVEEMRSVDPPDSLCGSIAEREVAIWCLVSDMTAGGRLVWHIPYIWTDSGQTVDSGREVYGYPKQLGYFDDAFDAALTGPAVTELHALAIEQYAPAARTTALKMISLERTGGPPPPGLFEPPADWLIKDLPGSPFPGDLQVNLFPDLDPPEPDVVITVDPDETPPPGPPKPPWAKTPITGTSVAMPPPLPRLDLLGALIENPTLVFLKQFRDVQCPTKACYQAIVEAPLSVAVGGTSEPSFSPLDPAQFALAIADWASAPVVSELGLGPADQLQQIEAAFQARFSFDVLPGLEVWRGTP